MPQTRKDILSLAYFVLADFFPLINFPDLKEVLCPWLNSCISFWPLCLFSCEYFIRGDYIRGILSMIDFVRLFYFRSMINELSFWKGDFIQVSIFLWGGNVSQGDYGMENFVLLDSGNIHSVRRYFVPISMPKKGNYKKSFCREVFYPVGYLAVGFCPGQSVQGERGIISGGILSCWTLVSWILSGTKRPGGFFPVGFLIRTIEWSFVVQISSTIFSAWTTVHFKVGVIKVDW